MEYTIEMAQTNAILIIREMLSGKTLSLDGHIVGMAENGFIGFVIDNKVSLFSEITFRDLAELCMKEKAIILPK